MQGNFALQQAINADTVANMQNTNAISTQLANCCCENRAGQKDIQYQMEAEQRMPVAGSQHQVCG